MNLNVNHNQKKLTIILFLIYLTVLSWIILFKMQFDISLLKNMNLRNINLIPFAGSLIVNGKVDVSEIILNTIVFIPFGLYVSIVENKSTMILKIVPIFIVSLIYETLQYIFSIGSSDITDLLGNTLGGFIGICIFFILSKILGQKSIKVINILSLIGTILIVAFLGLLIFANI